MDNWGIKYSDIGSDSPQQFTEELARHHPMLSQTREISAISPPRLMQDNSTDFYLLTAIMLILGMIRLNNPRYFRSLVRVFLNPARNSRQVNEQMQAAVMSNLLMNIFFSVSLGAYLYYLRKTYVADPLTSFPPGAWLLMLIALVILLYLGKYLILRLCGWAFRAETVSVSYLFNVFLINRIIGIVLLPFIVLLAFGEKSWHDTTVVISLLCIVFLLLHRYIRSWQLFGSFFQYSRFHFFVYLCASELLPLAVLMKLLVFQVL